MKFRRLLSYFAISLPLTGSLAISLSASIISAAAAQTNPASAIAQQIPVNAQVLNVNPTLGSDVPSAGSEAAPYKTIAYALEQAENFSQVVIQLAPGTYTADSGETFPLRIAPEVILRGSEANNGETVSILGGGIYRSPTFGSQNVTIQAAENSQIRGVTVTNTNTRGTAIWVESGNAIIRNNTLRGSNRDGVFATGRSNPTIAENVFTQNTGNGVSVAKQATGVIRNNLFQDTGFGVAVSETAAPLIEDNQFTQNTDGVVVSGSGQPILRRNVIQNNTRDGVVAITDGQPNLGTTENPGENIIQNNGRYAINNSTDNLISAVGNQINTEKIAGTVNFVAREVADGSGGFLDVQGHWAAEFITELANRGIISGFPDGTFRPNQPVTRAQFAAIVNQAFDPSAKRGGFDFADVSRSFWGYDAIQKAYRGQFLSGYPRGLFRPEQAIPRVQVLVALASGLGLPEGDLATLSIYRDQAAIPSYAVEEVAIATQRGLVVNYPTTSELAPNQQATRADVAAFVYQALVNSGQAAPIDSPYVVQPQTQAQQ